MIRMTTVMISIICITEAAKDRHDNYHRSILCITNAAEAEIILTIRRLMISMHTYIHTLHYITYEHTYIHYIT